MELPEILLIDKPYGLTSFDVIRQLRRQTGIRKFGHAGTLDPLATGLMIIGVEKGTKQLNDFIKLDKEYIAQIRFGEARTTGDLEGPITQEVEVESVDETTLKEALQKIVGTTLLPVSAYSAIKHNGTPLYKKARKAEASGEQLPEIPLRQMTVYQTELLGCTPIVVENKQRFVATVRFHVASGVYIRSLAVELGRLLGLPATLQNLQRTKVGKFSLSDAKKIEEVI